MHSFSSSRRDNAPATREEEPARFLPGPWKPIRGEIPPIRPLHRGGKFYLKSIQSPFRLSRNTDATDCSIANELARDSSIFQTHTRAAVAYGLSVQRLSEHP